MIISVYGMTRTSLVAAQEESVYFVGALSVVGPLSNLHCVFSDSPLCSLIYLVLWFSMFTVVFVFFLISFGVTIFFKLFLSTGEGY